MLPRPTIEAFDAHLVGLGLRLEAIVVGGSALALLGVTSRQTRDFDIIAPALPPTVLEAAKAFEGKALVLHSPGRADLLKTKLFALCDRGTDLPDCIDLAPTAAELAEASPWVELQDANPDWPAHVIATLADLGRRLGHGV